MAGVTTAMLQAARVAAGFMVVADAADQMEIPRNVLLRAEAGTTTLMPKYLPVVARVYGVREGFLTSDSIPDGRVEYLASVLVPILGTAIGTGGDLPPGTEERLKEMRVAVGYTSAKSAAEALGWKTATYSSHENGGRTLSAERMIGYALAMGIRPEFAVFGSGEMFPSPEQSFDWWSHRRSSEVADSVALSWTWLSKSKAAGRQSFPLVQIEGGKAELVHDGMMSQPAVALPSVAESVLYGVLHKSEQGTRIMAVDPRSSSGNVLVIRAGRAQVEPSDGKDYTALDPVRAEELPDGTVLGAVLFVMETRPVI